MNEFYPKIKFLKKFDRSNWRLINGVVVAVLFFVAFVFSYALPASTPNVPWQFYTIAGIFAITALIFAILAFDEELYGRE
jgi:hypothetical protein